VGSAITSSARNRFYSFQNQFPHPVPSVFSYSDPTHLQGEFNLSPEYIILPVSISCLGEKKVVHSVFFSPLMIATIDQGAAGQRKCWEAMMHGD